jgi:hypothetical protein
MKKTPSLFKRDYEGDRTCFDEVTEESAWVLDGEGVGTRKWDGTCVRWLNGRPWRRYDRKLTKAANKQKRTRTGRVVEPLTVEDFKPAPDGWVPAQDAPDLNTGHWPGWLPIGDEPESRWHKASFEAVPASTLVEGQTYEACGPHFQGNPEGFERDIIVPHGEVLAEPDDRSFEGHRSFFEGHAIEGIVYHHEDGRRAKVRRRDFGLPWPAVTDET